MNHAVRNLFGMAALACALAAPAVGLADGPRHGEHERSRRESRRRAVPEFDPSSVGVVAALVAGGGVLIARRRRNR